MEVPKPSPLETLDGKGGGGRFEFKPNGEPLCPRVELGHEPLVEPVVGAELVLLQRDIDWL
jgi:hypothetical protein